MDKRKAIKGPAIQHNAKQKQSGPKTSVFGPVQATRNYSITTIKMQVGYSQKGQHLAVAALVYCYCGKS